MSLALVRADTLCAWKGPSLLVTTLGGECDPAVPLSGFYLREARVLSAFRFEINGARPWLAEAAATTPARLDFNYVHPEITQPGGGVLQLMQAGAAGDEAVDSPAGQAEEPQLLGGGRVHGQPVDVVGVPLRRPDLRGVAVLPDGALP